MVKQITKRELFLELIEKHKGIVSIREACMCLYGEYTKHKHCLTLSTIRNLRYIKEYPVYINYIKEDMNFVKPNLILNEKRRNDLNELIVRKGERQVKSNMDGINNFAGEWIETDPKNKIVKQTIKIVYNQLLDKLLDLPKISFNKSEKKLIEEKMK